MSLLGGMKSDGLEGQEDKLGGFSRKATNIYPFKVKMAYVTTSKNGALGLNLILDIAGQEYREPTIWFTNRNKENFYYTKDSNGNPTTTKAQLPGFFLVNSLCRLTTGQELSELDATVEDKMVKVYDPDEKKEVNKSLPVVVGLLGAEGLAAIVEQTVNKTEQNAQTGEYDPIADTREENVIEHFFHLDTKASINEMDAIIKAENESKPLPEILFADQWVERYAGKKRDLRKIKDGQGAPKSGKPSGGNAPAASSKPATSSLFNRNK